MSLHCIGLTHCLKMKWVKCSIPYRLLTSDITVWVHGKGLCVCGGGEAPVWMLHMCGFSMALALGVDGSVSLVSAAQSIPASAHRASPILASGLDYMTTFLWFRVDGRPLIPSHVPPITPLSFLSSLHSNRTRDREEAWRPSFEASRKDRNLLEWDDCKFSNRRKTK